MTPLSLLRHTWRATFLVCLLSFVWSTTNFSAAAPVKGEQPSGEAQETPDDDAFVDAVGVILNEAGEPVVGATVTALTDGRQTGPTVKSNIRGGFRIASRKIYIFDSAVILVETTDGLMGFANAGGKDATSLRIVVKPPRTLTVNVTDPDGKPAVDTQVSFQVNSRKVAGGLTDAAGRWKGRIPADIESSTVYAVKRKVGSCMQWIDHDDKNRGKDSGTIALRLDAAVPFCVKAVDESGQPIAGVRLRVTFMPKNSNSGNSIGEFDPVTDKDGVAECDWMPFYAAKRCSGTIWAPNDFFLPEGVFWIGEGDFEKVQTLKLLKRQRISGQVRYADSRPASGIALRIEGGGPDNGMYYGRARTDAEGRYALKVNCDHHCIVAVDDKRVGAPARAVFVYKDKSVEGINFVLGPTTRLHGKIAGYDPKLSRSVGIWLHIPGELPVEFKGERRRRAALQFNVSVNPNGEYEIFLNPGKYRLFSPNPRDLDQTLSIPVMNQPAEVVRDFEVMEERIR